MQKHLINSLRRRAARRGLTVAKTCAPEVWVVMRGQRVVVASPLLRDVVEHINGCRAA
jgi:hypothetical protein